MKVRNILGISGGKDSAALAIYLKQKYPNLKIEYYNSDTGCELAETELLIDRLSAYLGNIKRLRAAEDSPEPTPFEHFLKAAGGFLPSPQARWCTKKMKLDEFERYVGDDYAVSYVGIRGDEDRDGYVSSKPNIQSVFPFRRNIWSVDVINRAVKELRSCYADMIDRVEGRLLETLGIESYDYSEYGVEIRKRLAHVKEYLLTDRLKEFYQHVMAEFDNRNEWYQSICYTALEQPLERLRDDQEEKLIDSLLMLFHECEKYSDISKVAEDESDEFYSLDLVSTKGSNIHSQTFRLPESEMQKAEELEKSIDKLLDGIGNDNVSVCTLLKILNKKLGK